MLGSWTIWRFLQAVLLQGLHHRGAKMSLAIQRSGLIQHTRRLGRLVVVIVIAANNANETSAPHALLIRHFPTLVLEQGQRQRGGNSSTAILLLFHRYRGVLLQGLSQCSCHELCQD